MVPAWPDERATAAPAFVDGQRERFAHSAPDGREALDGAVTTDPRAAIEGLLLPMAGHKGYGISFMMDVLSGVLGALLAQGLDPFAAACAGVVVHASAGRRAAERLGPEGMIASDVIGALPLTLAP